MGRLKPAPTNAGPQRMPVLPTRCRGRALDARGPFRAIRPLGPLRTIGPFGTLRTLWPIRPDVSNRPMVAPIAPMPAPMIAVVPARILVHDRRPGRLGLGLCRVSHKGRRVERDPPGGEERRNHT